MTISHQRASMQTAAIKNRDLLVETNDDKIDFTHNGVFWLTVSQGAEFGDCSLVH
jgi:hypothetical protein